MCKLIFVCLGTAELLLYKWSGATTMLFKYGTQKSRALLYFVHNIYLLRNQEDYLKIFPRCDELDDRGPIPDDGWMFFSSHLRSDRLWDLPRSYPLGTGVSFSGSEAAGAWSWPLTSI